MRPKSDKGEGQRGKRGEKRGRREGGDEGKWYETRKGGETAARIDSAMCKIWETDFAFARCEV